MRGANLLAHWHVVEIRIGVSRCGAESQPANGYRIPRVLQVLSLTL